MLGEPNNFEIDSINFSYIHNLLKRARVSNPTSQKSTGPGAHGLRGAKRWSKKFIDEKFCEVATCKYRYVCTHRYIYST